MATTYQYLVDPNLQFQNLAGTNNVAGFLRVYLNGTDTQAVTYSDFDGTANPSDIPLDNNGRAVVIADVTKTYRLEVYSSDGSLLWSQYPLITMGGGPLYVDALTSVSHDSTMTGSGTSSDPLSVDLELATVATTGSYDDLVDQPTIPAAQVNSDWDAVSGVAQILNKPTLATVATTGSYNDLSDQPAVTTLPYELSAKVYTANAPVDTGYRSHYAVSNSDSPIVLVVTAEDLADGYPYEFGSALDSGSADYEFTLGLNSTNGNIKVYGYRKNGTTLTSMTISIETNIYLLRVGTNLYIVGY